MSWTIRIIKKRWKKSHVDTFRTTTHTKHITLERPIPEDNTRCTGQAASQRRPHEQVRKTTKWVRCFHPSSHMCIPVSHPPTPTFACRYVFRMNKYTRARIRTLGFKKKGKYGEKKCTCTANAYIFALLSTSEICFLDGSKKYIHKWIVEVVP